MIVQSKLGGLFVDSKLCKYCCSTFHGRQRYVCYGNHSVIIINDHIEISLTNILYLSPKYFPHQIFSVKIPACVGRVGGGERRSEGTGDQWSGVY